MELHINISAQVPHNFSLSGEVKDFEELNVHDSTSYKTYVYSVLDELSFSSGRWIPIAL